MGRTNVKVQEAKLITLGYKSNFEAGETIKCGWPAYVGQPI